MPVVIYQRCTKCFELKPRVEFPMSLVGISETGRKQRKWGPLCKQCKFEETGDDTGEFNGLSVKATSLTDVFKKVNDEIR